MKITKETISEWRRKAVYHFDAANGYAEESHQYEGELSDAYSAASEAHTQLAQAFTKKADEAERQRNAPPKEGR